MTVPVLYVFVCILVAFALGWGAHGWYGRPLPTALEALSAPEAIRPDLPLVQDGRVLCVLNDRAGQWVSTQTRTGGVHPPLIEKPHGKQQATLYRLQGIQNGVGQYQEVG